MNIATRIKAAVASRQAIGAATPERVTHAPDGIQEEQLSHNKGHIRARVRAPMQLFAAAVNRQARAMAAAAGQVPENDQECEPPYKPTRLDMALDTEDGMILRWALSRYVEDCTLINMRGTEDGAKVDGSHNDGSRLPFNEAQRRALSRIAFVHAWIGASDRRDLQTFARMMAPLTESDPPSMPEFAHNRTGIADHRAQEGCFVGLMWKVAEHLYEIYRHQDFPERIEIGTRD